MADYNRKRDFTRTSEPAGAAASVSGRSFVIQQHDATRMHYDFRLEHKGVLWSWAVPKGPSLDPADKRLAVQTEDHPVSYREFEGHIPEGEYGGGPVIVWDRGSWMPEIDPDEGMRKGHLTFKLRGEKVQGRFQLVRLRGKVERGPKSNWLLIKRTDEHVRTGDAGQITVHRPESVLTGRLVGDSLDGATPKMRGRRSSSGDRVGRRPARAAVKAKPPMPRARRAAKMPALSSLDPQLATLVDRAPPGPEWIYEVKFDGYRMLASKDGATIGLRSRNGLDWTSTLGAIVGALKKLKARQAIVDGELCHVGADGRTRFQKLQNEMPRGKGGGAISKHLVYFVFDLLFCDGEDLRGRPLMERKTRLSALTKRVALPLSYSGHVEGDGATAFLHACRSGLEGLIAKRRDAPYREGRGKDWIKLKCQKRQEFVIVGMIRATGSRQGFRSLVVATRDGEDLVYAGRVGTGFSDESLRELAKRLARITVEASPLKAPPRLPGVIWVEPELVCEVEYTEITQDGSLRHPSFQGLREDKPSRQVRREKAIPVEALKQAQGASLAAVSRSRKRAASSGSKRAGTADAPDNVVAGVTISHPERVMDERSGTTKLDVARYVALCSRWLMPYVANRPLSLVRCPDGGAHQCFFQKHVMPGVGRHVLKGRAGGHEVLYVREAVGLLELVQFNAIELHAWGATMADTTRPDWFVIDLDPDTALRFKDVVDAALQVRDALERVGLKSWVKTTGGKGLHVCVPLKPGPKWEEVKAFTHAIARSLEAQHPDRYVTTMAKAKRVGKIFVDYLRNGEGATAVLPYSPRARPGATVAMPVDWKDLPKVDPQDYAVSSADRWLAKRRKDPWAAFLSTPQNLPRL